MHHSFHWWRALLLFFISSYLYISGFSTILMNLILICLEFIILSFTPTLFNSVEEPIEGRYGDPVGAEPAHPAVTTSWRVAQRNVQR